MTTPLETTGTAGPTVREANGHDRIEKGSPLTHSTTNISLSPELFEKVSRSPGRRSCKETWR